MRILSILGATGLACVLAVSTAGIADAAKAPAKTKLGCVVGKEKWDASAGKCAALPKKPAKAAKPKK